MATQQHTPGPWYQFDNGGTVDSGNEYGPSYADCVWGSEGPGHGLIADCSPHARRATEETIANARLIAAAPDLVKAAADWINWLDNDGWREDAASYEEQMLTAMRLAIARALGEPTPL